MTAIRVVEDRVPMRDGACLAVEVFCLADEVRRPTLLMRTPYGRPMLRSMHDPVMLARAGWAVVLQDVRGRLESDGEFRPFQQEGDDGADTMAWCAAQSWSDGAVVMAGASYLGAAQWLAAAGSPPALRAIAPITTTASLREHWVRTGGAVQDGFLRWWCEQFALTSALPSDVDRMYADLLAAVPDVDPATVDVAAFHVAGWYDVFCEGSLSDFTAAAAASPGRHRLVVGPWVHSAVFQRFAPHADFGPLGDGLALGLPFAHLEFLHAAAVGAEPPSTARVTVFRLGAGDWVELDAWPPATTTMQLWPNADGELAATPGPDVSRVAWEHDPTEPVPTWGGRTLMADLLNSGPRDQEVVEERPDVVTFTTPPMVDDLELMGPVRLHAAFVSTVAEADLVVKLCVVDPDGASTNLTDGVLRVADARTQGHRVIQVGNIAAVIPAGSRVRVQVAGSSFPQYDVQPTGRHTLLVGGADGTRLDLPVSAGGPGW